MGHLDVTNGTDGEAPFDDAYVSNLRCALETSHTLSEATLGKIAYAAAEVIAFAREGRRRAGRSNSSDILRVYSKHVETQMLAAQFSDSREETGNHPRETLIDIVDAYVAARADRMELELGSQHRPRGVHFLPLRISLWLGNDGPRWCQFLRGGYAYALFQRQYEACSAAGVHIVPLVCQEETVSSRLFPRVNAFLHLKTSIDDVQGKIQKQVRAVLQRLRDRAEGGASSNNSNDPYHDVVEEFRHAFDRAGYDTGKRFLTYDSVVDPRFYKSTRIDDAWRDDDALCEYLCVCDAYFLDERLWLSSPTEARTKADVLRSVKRFAVDSRTARFLSLGRSANDTHDRTATSLSALLDSPWMKGRLLLRTKQQRERLSRCAKRRSTKADEQPDCKRARFVSALSDAQRDCWGWCNSQLAARCTSLDLDERFVSLSASMHRLPVRRILQDPMIVGTNEITNAFRCLSFVSSVTLNQSTHRNELTGRIYGLLCVPHDVSNDDLNGARVFPGRVVCGVFGTAHQLRNDDPETSGTAHDWHDRCGKVASADFPIYADCSSQPPVRIGDRRLSCSWVPRIGFWKLIAVKPMYRDGCDLSAFRRSTDLELHNNANDDDSVRGATIGYVFGGNNEDAQHALPQRVRCAISSSLSEMHSR